MSSLKKNSQAIHFQYSATWAKSISNAFRKYIPGKKGFAL